MGYLFTSRRRIVLPHRLVEALSPFVRELVELLDGLGATLGDERWTEASDRLKDARWQLIKPSAFFEKINAIEAALAAEAAAATSSDTAPTTAKLTPPPRKGMARVAVIANKIVRRRRR